MAGRRLLSYDKEMNQRLCEIQQQLKQLGLKNVSKPDALRYILKNFKLGK